MKEMLGQNQRIEALKRTALRSNFAHAVPLREDGNVAQPIAREIASRMYPMATNSGENHAYTANLRSYYTSLGDELLYHQISPTVSETSTAIPNVESLRFHAAFDQLPQYNSVVASVLDMSRDDILQLIDWQVQNVSGKRFFSPFFPDETDITSQIEVTEDIARLAKKLQEKSLELQIQQPHVALVIDSITSAQKLPFPIPANTYPMEFDCAESNRLQASAFSRGDAIAVLATYGEYALVARTQNQYGWVEKRKIATGNEFDFQQLAAYKHVYYSGANPFFYTAETGEKKVLLASDIVYQNSEGEFFVPQRNKQNGVGMTRIPLTSQQVSEGIRSPQELLTFLYTLNHPYMWGIMDCSETIRKTCKLMGYEVGKVSSIIFNTFESALGGGIHITSQDQLTELPDGVYLTLRLPMHPEKKDVERHLYVATVQNGEFQAYSSSFGHIDIQGLTHNKVGPHIDTPSTLQKSVFEKDRALFVIKLTE